MYMFRVFCLFEGLHVMGGVLMDVMLLREKYIRNSGA